VSLAGAGVLAVLALAAPLAPWHRPSWGRAATGLALEALLVTAAVAAAVLVGRGQPASPLGRLVALLAAYGYATAGGVGVVRLVLALVPVTEREGAPGTGGIVVPGAELARGRLIGVLERAIALTLVLLGEYGALGLVVAAKALARFRGLEERDFAEYFLIGTLASLLVALAVGVGVRVLVR
jgi:hypothetical protein